MTGPLSDDAGALDALDAYRRANGLPTQASVARTWSFRLGPLSVRLPNFLWRRQAIDRHDLHHLLTDQPCTLSGECQVATWEFAAGAYPDLRPILFCLPLVALGFLLAPRRTWRNFEAGRRQRSLYGLAIDESTSVQDLRNHMEGSGRAGGQTTAKALAFAGLLLASAALYLAPLALLAWLIWS